MPEPSNINFRFYGLVELFGHSRIVGKVSDEAVGGCNMLRVDTFELPEVKSESRYDQKPAVPAYTRYFGAAAIYSMTPMSEAAARIVAEKLRVSPPVEIDVPSAPTQPLLEESPDAGNEDEEQKNSVNNLFVSEETEI